MRRYQRVSREFGIPVNEVQKAYSNSNTTIDFVETNIAHQGSFGDYNRLHVQFLRSQLLNKVSNHNLNHHHHMMNFRHRLRRERFLDKNARWAHFKERRGQAIDEFIEAKRKVARGKRYLTMILLQRQMSQLLERYTRRRHLQRRTASAFLLSIRIRQVLSRRIRAARANLTERHKGVEVLILQRLCHSFHFFGQLSQSKYEEDSKKVLKPFIVDFLRQTALNMKLSNEYLYIRRVVMKIKQGQFLAG